MTPEKAQKIVDEALAAARASGYSGSSGSSLSLTGGSNQVYLIAIAVTVVTYFVLQQLKPSFLLKLDENGQMVVCPIRHVLASVAVGLAAVAVQQYM